jgi:hypothetical protein
MTPCRGSPSWLKQAYNLTRLGAPEARALRASLSGGTQRRLLTHSSVCLRMCCFFFCQVICWLAPASLRSLVYQQKQLKEHNAWGHYCHFAFPSFIIPEAQHAALYPAALG